MVSISIRALRPDDDELLLRATVENFTWNSDRVTTSEVINSPEMVNYAELFPQRGDFGFVAMHEEEPVGVVWALYLSRRHPGWGFVDTEIPEISLWVTEAYRRQGISRMLIRAIQHGAKLRDLPGLSLSVERGNPAQQLYRSTDFAVVEEDDTNIVMAWYPAYLQ